MPFFPKNWGNRDKRDKKIVKSHASSSQERETKRNTRAHKKKEDERFTTAAARRKLFELETARNDEKSVVGDAIVFGE